MHDRDDDLIIGARLADPAGSGSAGETYVIYGGASLPATIDLNSTSADLTTVQSRTCSVSALHRSKSRSPLAYELELGDRFRAFSSQVKGLQQLGDAHSFDSNQLVVCNPFAV